MRFSGRAAASVYLDGFGALYGLPARRLAALALSCPRRRQEQEHRARSSNMGTARMHHRMASSSPVPMSVVK
jgi:hypothetical protein